MFQSTHPHGVRRFKSPATTSVKMFQSTHPHGVRQLTPHHYPTDDLFQSTHPHGVRPRLQKSLKSKIPSFNPRTHTGCDVIGPALLRRDTHVSIHAPTRGATGHSATIVGGITVSIHAPTRGATLQEVQSELSPFVSIHAPTRGATARFTLTGAYSISFNPRTHTGCDDPHIGCYNHVRVSIHAPTRGATRSCSAMGRGITCFNPRTHTGCDIDILLLKITGTCFNPRTHTGCDTPTGLIVLVGDMFQSTHPHGVRPPKVTGKGQVYFVFQSTHPHGVRHLLEAEYLSNYTFQSTHPHGVRPGMGYYRQGVNAVSIHAPTRGATSILLS